MVKDIASVYEEHRYERYDLIRVVGSEDAVAYRNFGWQIDRKTVSHMSDGSMTIEYTMIREKGLGKDNKLRDLQNRYEIMKQKRPQAVKPVRVFLAFLFGVILTAFGVIGIIWVFEKSGIIDTEPLNLVQRSGYILQVFEEMGLPPEIGQFFTQTYYTAIAASLLLIIGVVLLVRCVAWASRPARIREINQEIRGILADGRKTVRAVYNRYTCVSAAERCFR